MATCSTCGGAMLTERPHRHAAPMTDNDSLAAVDMGSRAALDAVLAYPCDCADDYTERGRHAPGCHYQFVRDYLDDDEIAAIRAALAAPRAPSLDAELIAAVQGVLAEVEPVPTGATGQSWTPRIGYQHPAIERLRDALVAKLRGEQG